MKGQISLTFVGVFYLVLVLVAWLVSQPFDEFRLLWWHNWNETTTLTDVAIGTGVGLFFVLVSRLLDRFAAWARRLSDEFAKMLGPLTVESAAMLAICSAVGEEIFFRGFLQQVLSTRLFEGPYAVWIGWAAASMVFGLLHIGPKPRDFAPWTAMALVMGGVFGWMYLYTGNVVAPIIAHFTINFLNLLSINRRGHG